MEHEEKKVIKILIAGEVTNFASDLSNKVFGFFEKNQISFKVEHAFASFEIFDSMSNNYFDIVLIDEKIKKADFLIEVFLGDEKRKPFWLFFFNSEKEEELSERLRKNIFKIIKEEKLKLNLF